MPLARLAGGGPGNRSSITATIGLPGDVRKAWENETPDGALYPATSPKSLIANPKLNEPPSVPRSSVRGLMALLATVRKAWSFAADVRLEPVTWPELLMPLASLE